MPTPNTPTPNTSSVEATPKRKRTQISYYESDVELDSAYASDVSIDDYSPVKKPKKKAKRGPKGRKGGKTEVFPFLSLPPELRNLVYMHALTDAGTDGYIHVKSQLKSFRHVAVRGDECDHWALRQRRRRRGGTGRGRQATASSSQSKAKKESRLSPALLAVNRQIHAEASLILYAQTVHVGDTATLHAFLAQIGPAKQALLRSVVLLHWGQSRGARTMNFPAMTLLAGAVNLESLVIGSRMGWGSSWSWRNGRRDRKVENAKRLARHFLRSAAYWLDAVARAKGRRDAGVEVVRLAPENFEMGDGDGDEGTEEMESEMERFRGELRKLLK